MTAYPDLRRGAEHRTDRNSGKVGQLVRDKSFDGVKEPADCGAAGSCYFGPKSVYVESFW
jgi:hypothetical protein